MKNFIKNNALYGLLLIFLLALIYLFAGQTFRSQCLELFGKYFMPESAVEENLVEGFAVGSNNFTITIDKIGIEVPVITGVDPSNEEKYNEALQDGVVHMLGTALPGQNSGNVFIYGHSSAKDKSEYGEIFSKMDELQLKDEIEISFEGEDYSYWVSEKTIVEKDDFSVLDQTKNEQLTLMTCWPIGTDDRRMIVAAKRINR